MEDQMMKTLFANPPFFEKQQSVHRRGHHGGRGDPMVRRQPQDLWPLRGHHGDAGLGVTDGRDPLGASHRVKNSFPLVGI